MGALYCSVMGRKIGIETCEHRFKNLTQFTMCVDCKDYRDYRDYENPTIHTEPTKTSAIAVNKQSISEDINSRSPKKKCKDKDKDKEIVMSDIDNAIASEEAREELEIRDNRINCKACGKPFVHNDENFSRVGPYKTLLKTCKACVILKRIETKEKKKKERLGIIKLEDIIKDQAKEISDLKLKIRELTIDVIKEDCITEKDTYNEKSQNILKSGATTSGRTSCGTTESTISNIPKTETGRDRSCDEVSVEKVNENGHLSLHINYRDLNISINTNS